YPQSAPDSAPFSFVGRMPEFFGDAPNAGLLAVAFDDAFAEWVVLPTGGFMPHFAAVPAEPDDLPYATARSRGFFNALRAPDAPQTLNTIHLVSADTSLEALGLTQPVADVDSINNWSWIFDGSILGSFAPEDLPGVREYVTGHELAHQYDVNGADPGGHDSEDAWTPPGRFCLMNLSSDFTLGIAKMHAPAGAATNDLMCIRSHLDDLDTTNSCSVP
ncbi:MAG: hypothetical protein K8J08_12660, partial [Thermoanaerobaculia bacterium]|nr:hypothetical protein [Thermoanaerobaculia bacterium]